MVAAIALPTACGHGSACRSVSQSSSRLHTGLLGHATSLRGRRHYCSKGYVEAELQLRISHAPPRDKTLPSPTLGLLLSAGIILMCSTPDAAFGATAAAVETATYGDGIVVKSTQQLQLQLPSFPTALLEPPSATASGVGVVCRTFAGPTCMNRNDEIIRNV